MPTDFGFKPIPKSNLKPSEILKQAKELISDKSRHTRGEYARNSEGDGVDATSAEACQWCSIGAVYKAQGEHSLSSTLLLLYDALKIERDTRGVANLNDRGTHEEVMQMFDKAIELAILKGD